MNSILRVTKYALMSLVLLCSFQSAQAVPVNPVTGASGSGTFGAVGSLIDFGGGTSLTFTLANASTLDFKAIDCCVFGDAFALVVDGVATAWTTETFPGGVGGNFIGFINDLLLGAGSHSLQLTTSASCCGTGGMSWQLSPAVVAVPEPGMLALLGLGFAGFAASRRKSKNA
jgi:hypothetical protein